MLHSRWNEIENCWETEVPPDLIGCDPENSLTYIPTTVVTYPGEDIVDSIQRAGYTDCTDDDIEF